MQMTYAEARGHGNRTKSCIRVKAEHVFGGQRERLGLFIGTIGIGWAELVLTWANMASTRIAGAGWRGELRLLERKWGKSLRY